MKEQKNILNNNTIQFKCFYVKFIFFLCLSSIILLYIYYNYNKIFIKSHSMLSISNICFLLKVCYSKKQNNYSYIIICYCELIIKWIHFMPVLE